MLHIAPLIAAATMFALFARADDAAESRFQTRIAEIGVHLELNSTQEAEVRLEV